MSQALKVYSLAPLTDGSLCFLSVARDVISQFPVLAACGCAFPTYIESLSLWNYKAK